jgi:hypothetical protein
VSFDHTPAAKRTPITTLILHRTTLNRDVKVGRKSWPAGPLPMVSAWLQSTAACRLGYKQYMLASANRTRNFQRGVQVRESVTTFRGPPHLGIREWLYAINTSGDSRRSESIYSLLLYIVSGDKLQSGERFILRAHRGRAMQDCGYECRRIHLLGSW